MTLEFLDILALSCITLALCAVTYYYIKYLRSEKEAELMNSSPDEYAVGSSPFGVFYFGYLNNPEETIVILKMKHYFVFHNVMTVAEMKQLFNSQKIAEDVLQIFNNLTEKTMADLSDGQPTLDIGMIPRLKMKFVKYPHIQFAYRTMKRERKDRKNVLKHQL